MDPVKTIRVLFRKGSPEGKGKPTRTATIRRNGGWFGPAGRGAPDVPLDTDLLSIEELHAYATSLARNGFFGPNSWYMNHARNVEYAGRSVDGAKITLPALFLHAEHDFICETLQSRLAEPMRADCGDLTEAVVAAGHWMAQERPLAVNAALVRWLATRFVELWPAGAGVAEGPMPRG